MTDPYHASGLPVAPDRPTEGADDTDAHWHEPPDRGGPLRTALALLILAGVVVTAAGLWSLARGEGARRCAPTASLEAFIADRYGERQVARGSLNESVVALYLDPETGSWTILQRYAEGASCVLASGTHWEFQGAPEAPKGERG